MYYEERKEVVSEAPVVLEPWRQHLLAAAECLRVWGWCQGTGKIGNRRCVQNAISYVVGAINIVEMNAKPITAYHEANKKLGSYLGILGESTDSWNDQPGRTVEEVIAALEGAARA